MFISVFTPTYNRAHTLKRLYESLVRQEFDCFEWIVVDDGSSDDTRGLVEDWIEDSAHCFQIRYIYQANSGKHVAWNTGLSAAAGDIFFPVDSDDYLTDDALRRIADVAPLAKTDSRIIAISGVRLFPETGLTGGVLQSMKSEYLDYSSIDRRSKGITGDLAEAFFTERLRKFPFPVYSDERFVPEAVVFNRFSNAGYQIRGYAFPLYVCEYLPDGYTKNTDKLLTTNWKGYTLYVRELMSSRVSIKAKAIPFCGYIYRCALRLLGVYR